MTEFKFFSSFHLGDQIFLLWFLNTAAKRFPYTNFSLWVPEEYYDEARRLARPSGNMRVVTAPSGDMQGHNLEGWMGIDSYYHNHRGAGDRFIDFMLGFHKFLAERYGIQPWEIASKREILLPWDCMDPDHALAGQSFDVLFINSNPLSGECHGFNQGGLDQMAVEMASRGLRVVTTHPCSDLPCTISLGLKLSHLGELASRCRFVAGVANAPFLVTFNEKSFDKVERWFNYSVDRVNFDDDRVVWAQNIQDLYRQTQSIT